MNGSSKYRILRIIALIIQVYAWVILALGVIGALILLLNGQNMFAGLWANGLNMLWIVALFAGVVNFVQVYIVSALLVMVADIADNTVANNKALEQLTRLAQATENARLGDAAKTATK